MPPEKLPGLDGRNELFSVGLFSGIAALRLCDECFFRYWTLTLVTDL